MLDVLNATIDSNDTDDHDEDVHDHAETFDPSVFNAALYGSADGLAGTTAANGKPIWSAEQAATYLFRAGAGYGTGGNMVLPTSGVVTQLNYGFHTGQQSLADNGYVYELAGGLYGLSEYFYFKPFTTAQKDAAREALLVWDDVVSTHFVETNVNQADIAFGNYTNQPGTQAYARLLANTVSSNAYVNEQIRDIGGDVWVNFNTQSNFQLDEGGYGMNTLVHEVGHGFGMLHPGDYNASPGVSLSYANNAEYYQDTRNYSILSYWNPRDIGKRDFDWTRMNIAYGATPMIHDILAMQLKYGADMTTRTGDTTYGFNSNAERDAFDFVKTPAPMMTIWDAGGIDTLDASGYNTNQIIDLTPGSFSSIGGITAAEFPTFAEVNANRLAANMAAVSQATYDANKAAFLTNPDFYGRIEDNVGIAYGVTVENAVGGGGNDTILGNFADNVLKGNAGNDLIAAAAGNDLLDGGTGNDEMLGGTGDDTYIVGEKGDVVTELANEGTDTVKAAIDYALTANVEKLILTGGALNGIGNDLANVLTGNAASNRLDGGAGNDRLIGGDGRDFLTGGTGADTFVAELNSTKVSGKSLTVSTDTILDFVSGTDKIDLSGLHLTSGHVVGFGANSHVGDLSFRVFTSVNGAENALGFDIDGIDGPSSFSGPVTVVFVNTHGGDIDVALALIGTNGVTANDFVY